MLQPDGAGGYVHVSDTLICHDGHPEAQDPPINLGRTWTPVFLAVPIVLAVGITVFLLIS